MIYSSDLRTVLVHFDAAADGSRWSPDRRPASIVADAQSARMRWYLEWTAEGDRNVFALVPNHFDANEDGLFDKSRPGHVVRYDEEGNLSLSIPRRRGYAFIINGRHFPIIQWRHAIAAAKRHNTDVLAFGPAEASSQTHYPESVLVDADGRVVRFKRHYFDSPVFADRWSGEASFLVVKGKYAHNVAAYVLVRGWGLDSIGSLVRRFNVRWSDDPGVVSDSGTDAENIFGDLTADDSDAFVADGIPPTGRLFPSPGVQAGRSDWPDMNVEARGTDDPVYAVRNPAENGWPESRNDICGECKEIESDCGELHWTLATDDLPDIKNDRVCLFAKRALDLFVSGVGLAVLMPFLIVVAVLVKLTSPGPAIFAHIRQGFGGKEFPCLKFRSMRTGADAMQTQLKPLNEVDGPQFKITDDPRLTRFGTWIRRWNIDELPQLFNVFVGQMSLVGPRPSPDHENQYCPAWRRARLSTKPGITGLWQVLRLRDENTSDFQEWIYYDVEYARHCSFWLDLQILFYTLPAIVASRRVKAFAERLERAGICAHSPQIDGNRDTPAPSGGG
ncbi:MAG: sugar transferase [Phycisphaerales bacterium]|nr:sugar transferase [Phycisphaerales bacterium]